LRVAWCSVTLAIAMCGFAVDCPVTTPRNPPLVAPAPHRPLPNSSVWYGTEELWTLLTRTGTWGPPPQNEHYRQKVFFWSKSFDCRKEHQPPLRFSGERLDGEAPPLAVDGANAVIFGNGTAAMLVGIDVPTTGCWEFTSS